MHESDPFRVAAIGLASLDWKLAKPLIFLTSVFILSNLIGRMQISHNRSVMREHNSLRLRKYSQLSAILLAGGMFASSGGAAQALTADDVLNNMSAEEQTAYIAGVVGGMAYSRFLRDRPDESGMSCIYDWFYTGQEARHRQINQWFERHLDRPAEPLLYVLIRQECGE